jgi:uncharacterized protein YyaL (SSP411 family)
MANYLANENSPYLLQHANNPVNWYSWSNVPFDKAKTEDKPIFLSIGYASCHWCHVMAHESFEDKETAEILNNHFISIKVDREERPDIDSIYMKAVVMMTGQGGWPLSVFLTPNGEPFFGGTYYPPVRKYNLPSFKELLTLITQLWENERGQLLTSSKKIIHSLSQNLSISSSSEILNTELLERAVKTLADNYDWEFGGWGQAPKFPQPMVIEFLLRRGNKSKQTAIDMAKHALKAMAKGGMYDVVGGGFSRYSVDNQWRVPHFEKMLYDNAQLSLVYLHAYLLTNISKFKHICQETLDFILREMTHPLGGFYSSLDADSEGEEGKFYLWTFTEIQESISDGRDASLFIDAYQITKSGNFEGKNILQQVVSDKVLSEKYGIPVEDIPEKLSSLQKPFLEARSHRVRPETDDKILVSWNSLMMMAFAEAGRYLKNVAYIQVAKKNASFILQNMYTENHLLRSWRDGKARHNAYLEDFASLVLALLSLYQSDPDPHWYQFALQLADDIVDHFSDPNGGFFDTRDNHERLLIRPKELQDNALPSGNALAVLALLQLSAYGDRPEFRLRAEKTLATNIDQMLKYPTSFAQWLIAADFAVGPISEIAILGNQVEESEKLKNTLWKVYRPNIVSAFSSYPPPPSSPKLLINRPLLNNQPTAFICHNFSCKQPVNSATDFEAELSLL